MKHFTGPRGGYDPLGSAMNSQAHRINIAMTAEPLTLQQVSARSKVPDIGKVCRDAQQQGLRYPERKADFIRVCFEQMNRLGGPEEAKNMLLALPGWQAKVQFLKQFKGIGDKYARNIMMIVYHEDFRNSIAVDSRIKSVTTALGLSFSSYDEHEAFYLDVARQAGLMVGSWTVSSSCSRMRYWPASMEPVVRVTGEGRKRIRTMLNSSDRSDQFLTFYPFPE